MIILLAGGLRPSPLVQDVGMSTLDMPLNPKQRVLDHWIHCLEEAANLSQYTAQHAIVAYTAKSPQPALPTIAPSRIPQFRFVSDQTGLRGPAGTARDLSALLDDDAIVFLGEAARVIQCDLYAFLQDFLQSGDDISIARNGDKSPAGIYLTRKSALSLVPEEGFLDLKEQWLNNALASGKTVRVYSLAKGDSIPLRTWDQYLEALRVTHGVEKSLATTIRFGQADRHASDNNVVVALPGAVVSPKATIIDSVLMPDCKIEEGAVVVRSFIGSGVRVQKRRSVIDRTLIGRQDERRLHSSPSPDKTRSENGTILSSFSISYWLAAPIAATEFRLLP